MIPRNNRTDWSKVVDANQTKATGLLVVGTADDCGKTVVTTGLTAAIKEKGFLVQALKPLELGNLVASEVFYTDQKYMNEVIRPLSALDTLSLLSAYEMTVPLWQQLCHFCKKPGVPCLFESVGDLFTPLAWLEGQRYDATHLAQSLGLPMVLVCQKEPGFLSRLIPTVLYAKERGMTVVGWVAVETQPIPESQLPHWETEVLWFQQEFLTPLLGELAFSPSIDVQFGRQGNLIRQTQEGIDLLPIQQALNLILPMVDGDEPRLLIDARRF